MLRLMGGVALLCDDRLDLARPFLVSEKHFSRSLGYAAETYGLEPLCEPARGDDQCSVWALYGDRMPSRSTWAVSRDGGCNGAGNQTRSQPRTGANIKLRHQAETEAPKGAARACSHGTIDRCIVRTAPSVRAVVGFESWRVTANLVGWPVDGGHRIGGRIRPSVDLGHLQGYPRQKQGVVSRFKTPRQLDVMVRTTGLTAEGPRPDRPYCL